MYTNRVIPVLSAWPSFVDPTKLTAKLWRFWTTIDSADRLHRNEGEDESTVIQPDGTFSFRGGPSFEDFPIPIPAADGIGLRVDMPDGQIFRSGFFDRLPEGPNDYVNIFVFDAITITPDDFTRMISEPPMTLPIKLDDCRTLNNFTATLQNDLISVSGDGTDTCQGVNFTFSFNLTLTPDSEIRLSTPTRAILVGVNSLTMRFSGSGSIGSDIEAIILNALSGWVERDASNTLRNRLQRQLDSALAKGVGRLPPLPDGVVVTVRRVGIRPSGIVIFAALGSFGDLLAKFPQLSPVGIKCFIATAAMGSAMHPHVQLLRNFRDNILLQSKYATPFESLLEMYYRFSPSIANAMNKNNYLRVLLRHILVYPIVFSLRLTVPIINKTLRIDHEVSRRNKN